MKSSHVPSQSSGNSNLVIDADSNMRSVSGFKFDLDGVLNKFSHALQSSKAASSSNSNPPGSTNLGYIGSTNVGTGGDIDPVRSHNDRLEAIRATAATLQSRIQVEARKITQHELPGRFLFLIEILVKIFLKIFFSKDSCEVNYICVV